MFQFAVEYDVHIQLTEPQIFPQQRNETSIMEIVLEQVDIGTTLQAIN